MRRKGFKQIPGFPAYFISKNGKIWSKQSKKYLKTLSDDNIKGYPRVTLFNDEGKTRFFVHRLVATVWKTRPPGKNQVNHNDWNVKNFTAKNLDWMSASENIRYNRLRPWGNGKPGEKYNHEKAKAAAGTPF